MQDVVSVELPDTTFLKTLSPQFRRNISVEAKIIDATVKCFQRFGINNTSMDDIVGLLLASSIDGKPFTDEEIYRTILITLFGGLDTTSAVMLEALLFMALNGCANRDESVFADADKCLLDRAPNPHIAFGAGAHICLGRNLGRLEIEVLLKIALERMHGYRVAESFVPEYFVGESRGMKTLPATF